MDDLDYSEINRLRQKAEQLERSSAAVQEHMNRAALRIKELLANMDERQKQMLAMFEAKANAQREQIKQIFDWLDNL